jgi:excisionase family DNA binding protein
VDEEKLTLTVDEAAAALGIGRTLAYEKCRTGELPSLKIGRRILISRVALQRMLEECGAAKRATVE